MDAYQGQGRSRILEGGALELNAADLTSKYGFDDGDLLNEYVDPDFVDTSLEADGDEGDDTVLHAALTILAKEAFGERLGVFGEVSGRHSLCHNPVRIVPRAGVRPEALEKGLSALTVVVPQADVLRAIAKACVEFATALEAQVARAAFPVGP